MYAYVSIAQQARMSLTRITTKIEVDMSVRFV